MAIKMLGKYLILAGVIMVIAVKDTSAMRHLCDAEECIPLIQCPALAQLLRDPSSTNIRRVQAATCFIEGPMPMVCCKTKRIMEPKPSTNSLIPYEPGSCGMGSDEELIRIFGGEEAPLDGYPWIVALGYREIGFRNMQYLCAGSIINERYILTAAHCVAPSILNVKSLDVITVGDWDLASSRDCQRTITNLEVCAPPSQSFTHEEIIIHPMYDKRAPHSDDIALIRLSSEIDLSGKWRQPVCLPPKGLNNRRVIGNRKAVVAGWGMTESGQNSMRLLEVLLPLQNAAVCNDTYGGKMVEGQICFGGVAGQDSCSGDSGGPLVMGGPGNKPPFLQLGIVSYGPSNCGLSSVPGVYTSVSYYRDWIDKNVKP